MIHQGASNYVVAVQGTTNTYFIAENGARLVSETLTPGKMTIFPAASIHTMYNTGLSMMHFPSTRMHPLIWYPP